MSDLARKLFGADVPVRSLALIVDLDDTICTDFDWPIRAAIDVLVRIDRQKVAVHYVTARTEVSRRLTEKFLEDHRLPGWRNLHFCPHYLDTRKHKTDKHTLLAREHRVIASIGDTDEDEGAAARATGVPFILVDRNDAGPAWVTVAGLIAAEGGFRLGA